MTDILCIPQKQTIDAHLKEHLAHAIELTSYQTASFFEAELNKIANLRSRISDPEPSQEKLQSLKQYWWCLHEIQKKFPEDQVEFTWFQPLSAKSKRQSAYSLRFEKLNILYNIGSLYSILALEANDGSTQALKTMCLYFQHSAGCFQEIITHLSDCREPVFDLNTGHALVYIMLSQAQECFWFKAIQDAHKNSLISRLAQQVVEYYKESLKYARKSELIREDWCSHLESKINYFMAVAYYRNGLFLEEKKYFGAATKSLELALAHLKKGNLKPNPKFMEKIEELLKEIQRDNDFIYLQSVPEHLDPVKPALMVKASPLDYFIDSTTKMPLFKDLLPIWVMDACSAFNERQEVYVKEYVVEPLLSLNKLLIQSVSKVDCPPDLKTITQEELESYELSLEDLKFNCKNIEAQLTEVEEILNEELESDAESRTKYGTISWTIPSSSSVNSAYSEKLQKLKDYLNQGRKVDMETFLLFQTVDKKLITSPIKLPESNSTLVRQVGTIIDLRGKHIKDTEIKSAEHRILPRIISEYKNTGKTSFEDLFLEHLKFFDSDINYVKSEKIKNKTVLEQLRSKDRNPALERLDPQFLYIEDLKHSMKLLEDIKRNLEEGTSFYHSLRKSTGELLSDVQNFEQSRSIEKQSLESKLNSTSNTGVQ